MTLPLTDVGLQVDKGVKKKSIQTLAVEIMSSHRTFSSKSDVGLMDQRLTLQLSTVYFFYCFIISRVMGGERVG